MDSCLCPHAKAYNRHIQALVYHHKGIPPPFRFGSMLAWPPTLTTCAADGVHLSDSGTSKYIVTQASHPQVSCSPAPLSDATYQVFCSYYYFVHLFCLPGDDVILFPRCFLPLYYVMWDFYIHLLSVCVSFSYIHISILGNVMFPHFIFVGAVYNHTISTYYVSPTFLPFPFLYYQYKIFCVGIQISLPLHLITTPTYIYPRPLDPQFTRGVPHHSWAPWSKYSGFPQTIQFAFREVPLHAIRWGRHPFFFLSFFWP